MSAAEPVSVREEPARQRYVLRVGDAVVGHLDYRASGALRDLVHTEVEPARRGQGLGDRLVRSVLDDARARGLVVTPSCPFVATFLAAHPGYRSVLADPDRPG